MFKYKIIVFSLISILFLLTGCKNKAPSSTDIPNILKTEYKFEDSQEDFIPIYADYHDDGNNLETYKLSSGWEDVPVEGTGKGLYIAGHNRSDDLFMGFYKELDFNKTNTTLSINLTFDIATNYITGSMGVGGSPADSVFIKAGLVNKKPHVSFNEDQNIYSLNVDKGNQKQGGVDMFLLGTLAKPEGNDSSYVLKHFETTLSVTTDKSGKAYLIIGTDSGFEGYTLYYIDNITIDLLS